MTTLQDYLNQVRSLIHDTNNADFTNDTLINFVNQARTRVAMDTHCVRGFLSVTGNSALNTITQQENYTYNGTIGGTTVTAGGTGYTSTPGVTFTGGGGTGAAATATVTSGVVTAINMTNWGQNYTTTPTVGFTGGGGSGAAATATLLFNMLDVLSITVQWGDERIMFEWMPFTMFQCYARQWVQNFSVPGLFTMHQGIQQVFMFPIPDQPYTTEWDIITLPTPMTSLSAVDGQVIAPWNDAVQFFAAHLAIASLQNYQMADYWYSGDPRRPGKYDIRVKQLPATSFSRRIFNPRRTFYRRLQRM